MDIKLIDKENGRITFAVTGTSPAFVNMMRRAIIEEVPTMAMEDIEIRQNSSALYDEMVALRLGLIPMKTDLDTYNVRDQCTCSNEGCAKCQVKITLKAEGPGTVYASDLQSKDPAIVPVFPKTPILKLIKEQSIELEATAVLGRGKDHVKWAPALAYYRNYPVVDIKGAEKCVKAKEVCPADVFDVKSGKLSVKNPEACILCGACVDECDGIKLNMDNKDFIFTIEPWGQLPCDVIVQKASEIVNQQFDEFVKLL
ncbi:DNA-directed RNA polymerase subunit D [Candidatus Woesearchaeota archaeon]|nr:DNA-directed RNA polymerase subunit D [Candidatus Woesearchaeota archaeon]